MTDFNHGLFPYQPSLHVPFRDLDVIERARAIGPEEFRNYRHPMVSLKVMPDFDITFALVTDMFFRIKEAGEAGRQLVLILPQPWPFYAKLAAMINRAGIDCRKLHTFNMDEYADEHGRIAPADWPYGFTHALKKYFYSELDPKLRPPENQMIGLSNETFADYGRRISDLGGADVVYMGPGWTGHVAFVEPDAPETPQDLEEFKQMGPRIVTLSPFTLAQNSLHGSFGASGDLAAIPPKAATIGPAQVLEAKHRFGMYSISVNGTATSWQKLTARLALFGPVTPKVPDSIIQLKPSEAYVSENIATPIAVDWNKGY